MPFPQKYQVLNRLPSPYLRSKLDDELVKINQLIKQLKSGYVDSRVIDLSKRYFFYLDYLCEDQKRLQSNAEWLLHYTKSVRLKLAMFLDECIRKEKTLQIRQDTDFLDLVESLTTLIAVLYSQQFLLPKDHQELHRYLTDLRITASYVKPVWTDVSYLSLRDTVTDLRDEYLLLVKCHLIPLDCQVTYQKLHHLTTIIRTHLLPSSH